MDDRVVGGSKAPGPGGHRPVLSVEDEDGRDSLGVRRRDGAGDHKRLSMLSIAKTWTPTLFAAFAVNQL